MTDILFNALAPALVSFAEFILDTFTGKGFLGRAMEGLIFTLQKAGLLSDKSGYAGHSASARADAAKGIIDKLSEGESLEDAAAFQHKMGAMGKDGIFGDFKGKTSTDFFHFLQKLIEADTDATNAASKTSGETMEALRKAVDEFKAGLKNPPPPHKFNPGGGTVDVGGNRHHTAGQTDALISAGNFLGALRGQIPDMNKQKIDLLRIIANNTGRKINSYDNDEDYPT